MSDWLETLEALFFPEYEVSRAAWVGRLVLGLALTLWGASFLVHGIDAEVLGTSFLHPVHLAFHEAGHLLFIPLGRFMTFLGGTLGQLLMPTICALALLLQTRDAFGASVATWWLGQSFLDCAPYIDDARAQRLMLVSGMTGREGGGHDWNNILIDLDLAMKDHLIARACFGLGALVMMASLAWGYAVLWRQHRALRDDGS